MASPRERIVLLDEKRNQRFEFPVNPKRIQIGDSRTFNEVPIVNLGVALLAGSMAPQEISFESFLPRNFDSSFVNYANLEVPEDIVDRILFWMGRATNQIQRAVTPLRVTITGTQFSQLMVITDFQHSYEGGEPDAIYFGITFRQWRRQRIRVEEEDDASGEGDDRQEPPLGGENYTVVRGDTLWKIAKRFYGSGSKWKTIYNANREVIGPNPNLIFPKQVLVIP